MRRTVPLGAIDAVAPRINVAENNADLEASGSDMGANYGRAEFHSSRLGEFEDLLSLGEP